MKFIKYIFILFLLLGFSIQVKASVSEGTINVSSHYALLCEDDTCATTSQINFLTTNGINVHITDSILYGNIWSSKMGWISLNPSHGGVTNTINGVLGGYAWGETTGWINFAPTHGGVSIDTNGNFTGWAWAQNAGWIKFDCEVVNACVNTDWRPFSVRPKNGGHPPAPTPVPLPIPTPIPTPIPNTPKPKDNLIPVKPITKPYVPTTPETPFTPTSPKDFPPVNNEGAVNVPNTGNIKPNLPEIPKNTLNTNDKKISNVQKVKDFVSKNYQSTKTFIVKVFNAVNNFVYKIESNIINFILSWFK